MTDPAKTRLRTTLVAWTVFAASVPALLVGVPLVGYIRWTTERTAIQELDLKASKVSLSLEQDVMALVAAGRGAASDSDVQRVLSSMLFLNRVDRLFADMIEKQPLIHEIRLLDKEGRVVSVAPAARAGAPTPDAMVLEVKDFVANHRRTPSARLVDENLTLFLPVSGLVGDTAGALTMTVTKASLGANAAKLVDGAAVSVLLATGPDAAAEGNLSAITPLRFGTGSEVAPLYRILVEEPAERRLAPVRTLTLRLSAGVAIIVLLFALVGALGIRRLTAPLEMLTQLVREVTAGRYLTKAPAVPFQELQAFAGTLAELGRSVQGELNAMRSQMNPHFLFNSLNSVQTMASFDPERAQEMISRLADLYRGILDSSKTATSPLLREVEIAKNYLELEKMRFGERLKYQMEVPAGVDDLHVPGLLLQTLVENAVKHGIAPSREGGSILVTVEPAAGRYRLSVRNSGAALTSPRSEGPGGTGLENSRRRLDLLYGQAHEFKLARDEAGETVASFLFTGEKK